MTEVLLVRVPIKEGQKKKWLEWCEETKRRSDEFIETMENEGMISGSCFLSDEDNAVYYFMESNDFKRAFDAFRTSKIPIDDEHKAIQEATLDSNGAKELKVLFHFRSPME